MTQTATEVYVTCTDFCGLKITETGEAGKAQHAEDCGASDAEIEWLDSELRAKQAGQVIVDGKPAKLVHDQTQPPLVEAPVTDESVLGNLARAMETEAILRTAANTAKNALAHAVKQTKAAAAFAAEHWVQSRQMAMDLTSGGTEPDDDDEDEGE
jgi:hypothetical protein